MHMTPRPPKAIEQLYAPQFEQFGFSLEPNGRIFTGKVDNALGHGKAWALPISNSCAIVEHDITPMRDMLLAEETPRPYACVTTMNESTVKCIPHTGIEPVKVEISKNGTQANTSNDSLRTSSSTTISFLQSQQGSKDSPLKKGHRYKSRSIMFFPDYFNQLDTLYPHEFDGIFESFSTPWNNEASCAIKNALFRLSPKHAIGPGAGLYMKSVVETMVAELAAAHIATKQTQERESSHQDRALVQQACALIERLLDEKHAPNIEELAERLYVSRSKLCATFASETGVGVGEYIRKRRMNRAEILLADSTEPIAQIATDLGFVRASTFSQAFRAYSGASPSVWRQNQR